MNLKQILCELKTLGKHFPFERSNETDIYCLNCDKYLFSDYDSKASRKEMRNSAKMWWEIKE